MQNRKFGALSSSVDPSQLSSTVSGLILTLSAAIIMVGSWLGIPLTGSQIGVLATQAGLAAGALWTIYGAVRKVVAAFSRQE